MEKQELFHLHGLVAEEGAGIFRFHPVRKAGSTDGQQRLRVLSEDY